MYGNMDIAAIGSTSCNVISMPICSFGRGVLGFFEAPAGTRGVVSLVIREFEESMAALPVQS
jgi:hypothetical protein